MVISCFDIAIHLIFAIGAVVGLNGGTLSLMGAYNINRGIVRKVEFKGLKAQYMFIFSGVLLGTLILVMIPYMDRVNLYICLFLGTGGASMIVWQTFSLNQKYREQGLMKNGARKRYPQYIICHKT